MKIIRVFPRRTNATPIDEMAFVGMPSMFAEADEVHISVTFSWDLPEAERLEKEWQGIAPVKIGGPATGQRGEEFIPGLYLKDGYTITSRGCPNKCWFCLVPKREGPLRELPIRDGWNILDDNLLACSDSHILEVMSMVKRQTKRPHFTGGLEAARLKLWHVQELLKVKPKELFFANDGPEDREPLFEAGKLLLTNGFNRPSNTLRAYVLIGYPKDTIDAAEHRMYETMQAGFLPMAMLYRDQTGERSSIWRRFAWQWSRPAIYSKIYGSIV
ncbi:hypothetical protein FACS1894161_4360 [Spirochaetia bacterium]|nr:hypothetical protein FACS1894161_4360 [Spirochaetia bacterium]